MDTSGQDLVNSFPLEYALIHDALNGLDAPDHLRGSIPFNPALIRVVRKNPDCRSRSHLREPD